MRRWFKASFALLFIAITIFFVDYIFSYQIDNYLGSVFGFRTISLFGYYPNGSLVIFIAVFVIIALGFVALLIGYRADRQRIAGQEVN